MEGTANCTSSCEWDVADCWSPQDCLKNGEADCEDPRCAAIREFCPVCGDGMATADEVCDGEDPRGQACTDHGFASGTLTCSADCTSFDTTACSLCGNAVIDEGEECDDGNITAGDGCSSTCELETGVCGGTIVNLNQELVPIVGGDGLEYTGTLVGAGDDSINTCQSTNGLDVTHSLFVENRSLVHVMAESLAPTGTLPLSTAFRTNCADHASEFACHTFGDDVSKVEVPVEAGTQLYLVVDTDDPNSAGGPYRLEVYVIPMVGYNEPCDPSVICEPPYRCSASGICADCPKFGPCP